MANLRFYLDTRKKNETIFSVRLAINHKSQTAYITMPIKILESQWDKHAEKIINHAQSKLLNNTLINQKAFYISKLMNLSTEINLDDFSALDLKYLLLEKQNKNKVKFVDCYNEYVQDVKVKNTKNSYVAMFKLLSIFYPDVENLLLEKIDVVFLEKFYKYLKETHAINTAWLNMSKFRTIVRSGVKKKYIEKNPFIDFSFKKQETRKRNLGAEKLKEIFAIKADNYSYQRSLDIFKLSFCLIGINLVDLFNDKLIISDGRVDYERAKTHKWYSVKIFKPTKELLEKFVKRYKKEIGRSYSNVGLDLKEITGKKDISIYWARHTWASIASNLDIPKEVIANALGHSQNSVTDIYIDFNQKKIDDANEKVLKFVFGEF